MSGTARYLIACAVIVLIFCAGYTMGYVAQHLIAKPIIDNLMDHYVKSKISCPIPEGPQ